MAANGGIELEDGRRIAPDFRAFTHGYCVTRGCSDVRTPPRGEPVNPARQGGNTFDKPRCATERCRVSKLEWIETEVRQLPRDQALALQDWLGDYLEAQAELNPDFDASIERGEADLGEGRMRNLQP